MHGHASPGGEQQHQRVTAPVRHQQSTARANRRQDHSFREKLLQQPAATRPHRQPHRHLMPARNRPDQQQIPDVCARDEQHKNHHRDHDFQRGQQRARIVERRLPQRPQLNAAPAVRLWIFSFQSLRRRRDLLLRLRLSRAATVLQFVPARFKDFLHRRRHPELHRPAHERPVKSLWLNPHDGVDHTVEPLGLPDDLRISLVFPHP